MKQETYRLMQLNNVCLVLNLLNDALAESEALGQEGRPVAVALRTAKSRLLRLFPEANP